VTTSEHSSEALQDSKHTPRTVWPPSKTLNYRDSQILHLKLSGHTDKVVAERIGCCTRTVEKAKQKQEYRDVVIAAAEQEQYTAKTYAQNMVAHTKAIKRTVSKKEGVFEDPDNLIRFNADKELGDVFGVKAPKKVDLKHTMAAMSDDELLEEIKRSAEGMDARSKRTIAGDENAGADVTHQFPLPGPGMVCPTGEQAAVPTDG